MVRYIALLSFLLFGTARADIFTARIDASATNIGTSYQLVVFPTQPNAIIGGFVNNRGTSEIAVTCSYSASPTPSTSVGNYIDAAGGEAWAIDDAKLGNRCYVRSLSGSTISSGIYVITVKGY